MPHRVHKIVSTFDKALSIEASKYCRLSIQLSQDGFSFCVFDINRNKYCGIEVYEFNNVSSVIALNAILRDLVQTNDWLQAEFEKTEIIFETSKSTLVPVALFDHNHVADYLKLNHPPDLGEVIGNDHLRQLDAENVFSLPDTLLATLREHFPGTGIHHFSSSLIESLLIRYKNLDSNPIVFTNVRKSWLDIMVISKGKLQFFNSFRYKEKEDFVYFLIFVFEQLNLNPENTELKLMGEIPKVSPLFDLTFRYIRNVGFVERSNGSLYSYIFDEIPHHYYFNLLNLQHCEL
jgi:hypothetical protein